jgi:hypothetical protein
MAKYSKNTFQGKMDGLLQYGTECQGMQPCSMFRGDMTQSHSCAYDKWELEHTKFTYMT